MSKLIPPIANRLNTVRSVLAVLVIFALPMAAYANENVPEISARYLTEAASQNEQFTRTDTLHWVLAASENQHALTQISVKNGVVKLRARNGDLYEIDLKSKEIRRTRADRDTPTISALVRVELGLAPELERISNLNRVQRVHYTEGYFERLPGNYWREIDNNGQFLSKYIVTGERSELITLVPTDGSSTYARLDFRERKILKEKNGKSTFLDMQDFDVSPLPSEDNGFELSAREVLDSGRKFRLRLSADSRVLHDSRNGLVLDYPNGSDEAAAMFELSPVPSADCAKALADDLPEDRAKAAEKQLVKRLKDQLRLRNSHTGNYLTRINAGVAMQPFKTGACLDQAWRVNLDSARVQFLNQSEVVGESGRDKSLEMRPKSDFRSTFVIERVVDATDVRMSVAADLEGGIVHSSTEQLMEKLSLEVIDRQHNVMQIPMTTAWTQQKREEGLSGASTKSTLEFKMYSSSAPHLKGIALGDFAKIAIRNNHPSHNIYLGDIRLRNFEIFRCNCMISPGDTYYVKNMGLVAPYAKLNVAESRSPRLSPEQEAAARHRIAALSDIRGVQMTGTPQQKRAGFEVFEQILATDAERYAFDAFLREYPGYFIASFVKVDVGRGEPALTEAIVAQTFDRVKKTSWKTEGTYPRGFDPGKSSDVLDHALRQVEQEVLKLVRQRSVLTDFFYEIEKYLNDRYTVASKEAELFFRYAGIANDARQPNQKDPAAVPFAFVLAMDNIAKSIPNPTVQGIGHSLSVIIDVATQIHDLASEYIDGRSMPSFRAGSKAAEKLSPGEVNNQIIEGVSTFLALLAKEKTNSLVALRDVEQLFLSDLDIVAVAGVQLAKRDRWNVIERLSAEDVRSVRREVWSALLPLDTALIAQPVLAFSELDASAPPPVEDQPKRAEAIACIKSSDNCSGRVAEGFNAAAMSFYSPTKPVRRKVFQEDIWTNDYVFMGWSMVGKPWNLDIAENDVNPNDRTFMGVRTIAVATRAEDGTETIQTMSFRDFINSLFETPDELYDAYFAAGEVFAYRQHESSYNTNPFYPASEYSSFTAPEELRLGNLQVVEKDPYLGERLDNGSTWSWRSADRSEGNQFFLGNMFDLGNIYPSDYDNYKPGKTFADSSRYAVNPPALAKRGTAVRTLHSPKNVVLFQLGDFFWPPE